MDVIASLQAVAARSKVFSFFRIITKSYTMLSYILVSITFLVAGAFEAKRYDNGEDNALSRILVSYMGGGATLLFLIGIGLHYSRVLRIGTSQQTKILVESQKQAEVAEEEVSTAVAIAQEGREKREVKEMAAAADIELGESHCSNTHTHTHTQDEIHPLKTILQSDDSRLVSNSISIKLEGFVGIKW